MRKEPKPVRVVDLFAGAGGFGVAAGLAGAELKLSVEIDETCCRTLLANSAKGQGVLQGDVSLLSGSDLRAAAKIRRKDALLIVGGPPCQPFSKASYWTDPGLDARFRRARARGQPARKPPPIEHAKDDDRRGLLDVFRRLVCEAEADGFVLENVPSLLHPRNLETFRGLITSFEDAGYACSVSKVEATLYGVPQKRTRLFVLGSRRGRPLPPAATHRSSSDDLGDLPIAPGVEQFIAPFASNKFFEDGEIVSGRWADCLRQIPPGWNYKHLTEWAGHPHPVFEAETRFWNFLLKLDPKRPSWTLNANPGPWVGPFHWRNRRLRTPELAAIQTFPHKYHFEGSRRERVRQIGNAVPPQLARPMIEAVISVIS
jgi:DNA (cytosine-5)-methyltransferase 1